jgi:O-antigen ligase
MLRYCGEFFRRPQAVLLWVLALVGMLWAIGVPMAERVDGLSSYHKLLTIPLLIAQFQRSDRGRWVMIWFFISCGVMLVVSWALFLVPSLPWPWYGPSSRIGVPVKDYIAQSGEFTACVLLLAAIALDAWRERRHAFSIAMSLLALAFLANIFYISTSRTSLVVIPILLLLFACKRLPWTATAGALFAAVMLSIFAWSLAPEVKNNITDLLSEVRRFQPEGKNTRAGERLEFWRKSIGFIADAPIIGHGTGSIRDQFRHSVVGQIGMAAMAAENPHNQTIAVAIQLGLVGTAALFAMWLAHVLLFRGDGIIAWAGLLLVTQNVVGSLFNSHLFDFTQGWGYVIGVGVAGGMIYKGTATSQSAAL